MTNLQTLVNWEDFILLPERPEDAKRYELQDGEVVLVPPARPIHIKIQKRIEVLLEAVAGKRGVVATEFPYRPGRNLQYWFADVAYIPKAEWDALPANDYPIYSPPLIVEVLSSSNTSGKIDRQRIVALSAGTMEFWVVDPQQRTVQVTSLSGSKIFHAHEELPLGWVGNGTIRVEELFAV